MKLTGYLTSVMLILSSSFIANAQWSLTGNASTNPTTNFLGTTDAQSVVFKTNNTEIFRLFATDNTLSMSAPIRMNNNAIYFGSTAADPYYYIQNIGWDQGMKYIHYTSHQFFTNSGEKMRIIQNGNVGIGTTTPGYKLTVKATFPGVDPNEANGLRLISDGTVTSELVATRSTYSWAGVGGNEIWLLSSNGDLNVGPTTTAHHLKFMTGQAERVRITNTGNVGIGTIDPENSEGWNKVLEVKGALHAKLIVTTPTIQTGIFSHVSGGYGAPAGGMIGTATNHPVSIITNKVSRITVATSGNVGIGTTNPTQLLTVNGNISMPSGVGKIIGVSSGHLQFIPGTDVLVDPAITLYGSGSANPKLITIDGAQIRFRPMNGTELMRLSPDGVAIGVDCVPSGYKLAVKGNIICEKLKVKPYTNCSTWADYVFASDYKLLKLNEVEAFIKKNKHLPGVPSAEEVDKNGIEVVEMDATLLKKIEELTLYVIELQKQVDELKKKQQ